MRAAEFIKEEASGGSTCSGVVATMAAPMGMIARNGGSFFSGKYTTDPTPNTPSYMKKGKKRRAN
jgi:hypothetical protein